VSAFQVVPIPEIRPVDIRHDLPAIADLIEVCFGEQMDEDGREYIRQIRRASMDRRYLRWLVGAGERVSYPLHGYVWVEDKKIIGNLTLIPHYYNGQWYYLIANVAVEPSQRKQGIGRKLTEKALQHIRDHGAHAAWLHVRDDNEIAYKLYLSLGMVERARRTTWQSGSKQSFNPSDTEFLITPRSRTDWEAQIKWLNMAYPPEVTWNLPLQLARFNPGFWSSLLRFLNGEEIQHWSVYHAKELVGVVTWEPNRQSSNTLWMAINPVWQQEATYALLTYIRHRFPEFRQFQANYPDGQAVEAFQQAGFEPLHTLIWMEMRFR
jgi:ribosomal protein S18 acetylase RimI-like enzyme